MSKKLIYYFKRRIEARIQKMIPTNFCFPLLTQTFSTPLLFSHSYFLVLMSWFMFYYNCFAFPYTSPWLSLFQSSIRPVLPLPTSLSLPFFICGSSILCHIFHSSFASEELWAKASSLPQQKVGTEAHTKQRLLWERGESRSPPNHCLLLLPFESLPLRNSYFISPPTHTSMGGKGSKRSLKELPDHEYSKKKKHSLLAKEEQMCMLSLEPLEILYSHIHWRK